jgi:GNAT superfamily N-acetyltransferase
MGKGAASAKDAKKAVRAALDAKEKERTAKVKAALTAAGGAPRNVMADLAPFARFDRNGLAADITQASVEDAATWSPELEGAVFELTKANMREMYEAAPGWGWSDKKKRAELFAPDMRFLVARARDGPPGGPPLGFVAFSFLLEGEYDAAYVFELQLAPEAKRRGLGRHLMACVELAARKAGLQW